MKSSVKKLIIIELIVLLTIIFNFFNPFLFNHYKYLIFLFFIGLAIYFSVGIDINSSPNEKPYLKNEIICILVYFVFIYLSGLFVGFSKPIYSWSFTNLVKNIIPTITVIFVCEILRNQIIKKSNKNLPVVLLSFLIFTLLDICIGYYDYNLNSKSQLYEFLGLVIMCSIPKNILFTILNVYSDHVNSIVYRLFIELYVYIVPIVPDYGPYIESVLLILLPVILSVVILNSRTKKIEKPEKKNRGKIIFIVVTSLLGALVLINSGLIKYQTLVIGSNSMKKYMEKGDVVFIEKLNNKEKKNLKVGEILIFKYDNKIVAHRIHEIVESDNSRYFITKGDNNDQVDNGVIYEKNIIGKVNFRIKYIGLPSIWLQELFE